VSSLSLESPLWYPLATDRGADAVQFAQLTEREYEAASFLDGRFVRPEAAKKLLRWNDVRAAVDGMPERCHFIFHISHCGSTLLARLLGCHKQLFSLREPAILRNLAEAFLFLGEPNSDWGDEKFEDRLSGFLKLWSRTFRPEQTSVVKATSFVSDMARHLLERRPAARAILMYIRPERFLKAMLHGLMEEVDNSAAKRWRRVFRYLGEPEAGAADDLSPGERVAMSWLAEVLALDDAAASGDRCLWIDFDDFLASPADGVQASFSLLGVPCPPGMAAALCASPLMTRYSKAPQHGYDAGVRERFLAESATQHGEEIIRGLRWLETFAQGRARVQQVLAVRG
jgi:hypothetical protein